MSDWHFLSGLAREIGYEVAVRDDKFEFCSPAPGRATPRPPAGPAANPLVLELGTDLLRVRSAVTSAEQVKEIQVRGWDIAQKKAIIGTAPARTTSAELPGTSPADLAHVFGDPTFVATDVPYRLQAEVDVAARAVAEQIAGAFAELDAVTRGNPKIRAGTAVSIGNLGPPFDGKYTVTTSRHHFDQTAGYVTQFAVTGRQERSLLGLASGGGAFPDRRLVGVVVAQVSDVNDPQGRGRVKLHLPLAVGHLRQRLGAHRPAGRGQGPRRDGRAGGRRRGARGVRAGRHPPPVRAWAACTTAWTPPRRARPTWSTPDRARSTAGHSSPGAGTGSTSSTRPARPKA